MNMNNLASVFIEKSILGTSVQILQIGVVFIKDNKFKYFYKYIKNDIKNSNSAIDWQDAVKLLDKIISDKKIILKNDDNNDFKILNNSYKKFLNKDFNNFFYDIAKNSEYLGYKKFNIDYLSSVYDVKFKNTKGLPTSVFKAQKIFAIGSKMFKLGLKNV
ncbi:hypothetical protein D8X55_01770 [Malacoplasma penetrans]|uniref:Uncharacterized protein n=1 Tax=Malacoplasma penetrans (strain HF-2) TaxID=272633 RepID=Q8EWQ9_MALP2|nr:hypothetical protein [Malacoplasma penetrans]RXY97002.1 hypothetical protein D8X55_01770 [Malacoplasma penetrans]BAC43935.1 conserved hypothetical protein [Malacoplasma penetrans HF-2]